MARAIHKKAVAAVLIAAPVVVSVGVAALEFPGPAAPIKDSIVHWVESANVWALNNKLNAAAGGMIASAVRERLDRSAPAAQVTVAAASLNCDQQDRVTPGTALVGDRLTIRFFEHEMVKPAPKVAGTSNIYFERLDLSGTYEVDAQGEVSLPMMGRIKAEGLSIGCLEAVVTARHAKAFSAPATASAAFASRAPILVVGSVRAEGIYNYTQGMTLRHVLALAGALPSRSMPGTDIPLLARKAELDALKAGNRLKMLVLASARAGSTSIAMSEGERLKLVAALGSDRLEVEAANLRARVEARSREQKELATRIEHGRARVELLIEEKARLERHVTDKQARLKDLRDLTARGIAPLSRLSADEAILTALEQALFDIRIELLQAENRLEVDVRALNEMAEENERTIAAEIRDRAEEGASIEAQLAAIEIQLNPELYDANGASSAGAHLYTIVRTTTQGTTRSQANLDSPILPGDIVEVEALAQAERVTSLQ